MRDGERRVLITTTLAALREFASVARRGELLSLDELFVLYRSRVEEAASAAYDEQPPAWYRGTVMVDLAAEAA
jgi:hypothetical protein